MPKRKTQKVKFHKGDQRPGSFDGTLSYTKKMKKKGKDTLNIYLKNYKENRDYSKEIVIE